MSISIVLMIHRPILLPCALLSPFMVQQRIEKMDDPTDPTSLQNNEQMIESSHKSGDASGHGHQEIYVGCMVEVISRTWPGINKPGGVARVTKCHYAINGEQAVTPELTHVDVRYVVMGGRERRVAMEYCRRASQYETNTVDHSLLEGEALQEEQPINTIQRRVHLRDRSLMLGRCKKCGSLRMDCGSCDWVDDQQGEMEVTRPKVKSRKRESQQDDQHLSDSSSASSSDDLIQRTLNASLEDQSVSASSEDDLFKRIHKAYSRLKSQQRKESRDRRRTLPHQREAVSSLETLGGSINQLSSKNSDPIQRSALQGERSSDEDSLFALGPVFGKTKKSNRLGRYPISNPNDRRIQTESSEDDDSTMRISTLADSSKQHQGIRRQTEKRVGPIRNDSRKAKPKRDNKESRIGIVRDCEIGDTEDEEDMNTHIGDSNIFSPDDSASDVDEDDFSYDSTFWDDRSERSEYLEDGFIQPEGEAAANNLPRDIVDQTEGFSYEDIVHFFRSKSDELGGAALAKAQECSTYFQSKLNELYDTDLESQSTKAQLLHLECVDSYKDMCRLLVVDGIDQCRLALKKILKQHKSEGLAVLSKRDIDDMDCGFDALQLQIEDVLRGIRLTLGPLQNLVKDESLQVDDDRGYQMLGIKKQRKNQRDVENFDPHPFATRKRIGRRIREDADSERQEGGVRRRRNRSVDKVTIQGDANSERHEGAVRRRTNRSADKVTIQGDADSETQEGGQRRRRSADKVTALDDADSDRQEGARRRRRSADKVTDPVEGSAVYQGRIGRISGLTDATTHSLERRLHNVAPSKVKRSEPRLDVSSIRELRSTDQMFQILKHSTLIDDTASLGPDLLSIDVAAICNRLSEQFFVASERQDILSMLPIYFQEMRIRNNSVKSASKLVLTTFFTLFQLYGGASFVEMMSCHDENIVPCIQLFTCLFNLIALNIQAYLDESDGKVFRMIKIKKQEIIETISLLLIDILYSQILRDEWGDPDPIRPALFQELSRLSMALGKNVPIVETIARLLVVKFGCQCWYQVSRGSRMVDYVSSINPSSLLLFWADQGKRMQGYYLHLKLPMSELSYHYEILGDVIGSGSKNRFELLSSMFSRREIDALWMLLAFFGNCGSGMEASSSSFRWKLLLSLLDTPAGIFASNPPGKDVIDLSAPPSETHIKACTREIRHLCTLLSSGALDPLQADNTIMIRIFQNCVHLGYKKEYHSDDIGRRYPILSMSNLQKKTQKLVEYLWKESDIAYQNHTSYTEEQLIAAIADFSSFHLEDHPKCTLSLSSDSVLLRSSLHFIKLWIQRHPDKRARWLRLNDSIHVMIKMCDDLGCTAPSLKRNDGDRFQSLFKDTNESSSQGAALSFAREASASLLLCVAHTRLEHPSSSMAQDTFPLGAKLDKAFCKQIWTIIATKEMVLNQESLVNQIEDRAVLNLNLSLQEISSASKVMTALTFLILKSSAKELDIIGFLTGCILTCFSGASDSLATSSRFIGDSSKSLVYADIVFRLSYWLNLLVTILAKDRKLSGNGQSKRVVVMVFSVVQQVVAKMLQVVNPGKFIDWAFRCCLSVIRASTTLLGGTSQRLTSSVNARDSPNHEIDDDRLMRTDTHLGNRVGISPNLNESACSGSISTDTLLDCDANAVHSTRNLCQFLLHLLANSVPSLRFALPGTMRPNDLFSNLAPLGREVVAQHSGGVAATLAALVNALGDEANNVRLSPEFSLPQNIGKLTWSQLSKDDCLYYKRTGYVFIAEICRLAHYYDPCLRLIQNNYLCVLENFINAIIDADILACFPITNYAALLTIGDESCVSKEKERRQIILDSDDGNVGGSFKCDTEAAGIKKGYGEMFDSPGPSSMSKRIWSFGHDIGHAFASSENRIETLSAVLLHSTIETRFAILDTAEALPRVSMERECVRRSMMVRAILHALLIEHGSSFVTIGKRLFFTMLHQHDSVIAAINYLRQSEEEAKIHDVSKARLLCLEYGCFLMDILSWILIRSRLLEGPIIELTDWLWEHIISIAAKDRSQRINIFYLLNDLRCIDAEGSRGKSALVQHYLTTLIFYIGNSSDQQFIFRNTHLILDSSLVHLGVGEITTLLYETVSDGIGHSFKGKCLSDFLVRQDLITRKELTGYEERCKSAGANFRSQAFRHFLSKVKLSGSSSQEEKEQIFAVLRNFLVQQLGVDMNIEVNITDLQLICELIAALSSLFVNALLQYQDDLLEFIYQTFISMMKINTRSGCFFQWIRQSVSSRVQAQYIMLSFEWLQVTSMLIAESSSKGSLNCFLNYVEDVIITNIENQYESSDFSGDMARKWILLHQEKSAVEMTLAIRSSYRSTQNSTKNPYAKISQPKMTFTALEEKTINSARMFLNEYALADQDCL